jgi:hypothetical protein
MKELFTVLEDLVQLKKWKNSFGKDDHYKNNIKDVWERAFKVYEKYDDHFNNNVKCDNHSLDAKD